MVQAEIQCKASSGRDIKRLSYFLTILYVVMLTQFPLTENPNYFNQGMAVPMAYGNGVLVAMSDFYSWKKVKHKSSVKIQPPSCM